MEKLTIQEEEAMLYIWELGSCFVKDIVAKYPKPAPPYMGHRTKRFFQWSGKMGERF